MIVFGSLPLILLRPSVGIMMWAWVAYMNPHRLTWGFAFDFPFNQVVAITTMISILISSEPKKIPWNAVTFVWLAFIAWMCVTTLFSVNPEQSQFEWERSMKIQLMVLATLVTITTAERIKMLVLVIALSLGFFGVKGGIFTILKGGQHLVWGPYGSFIHGNNELAFALVMITPLIYYLYLQAKKKWARYACLAMMGLVMISVLGSYSRGALLAFFAMAVFLIVKSRHRAVLALGSLVVAGVALLFMPDQWMVRMTTIASYTEDSSAMGRINAWGFAINFAADNPIFGGGFQVFQPELFLRYAPDPDHFVDAHSIYFEVLAEQGYVGLALFLLLGLLTMHTGRWIVKHSVDKPGLEWARDLGAMVQVSIVGYAVGGAFLGLAYFDLVYHLMAILLVTRRLVEQHDMQSATTPKHAGDTLYDFHDGAVPRDHSR